MLFLHTILNYYYISFHKDNLKMNKNDIHITADRESKHTTAERESKELSVDLE